MRVLSASSFVILVLSAAAVSAQPSQPASSQSVPRLINIAGVFRPVDGRPAATVETVTLSIYADPEGGAPLWQETQTIALDAQGRYSLLLGATRPEGIPADVFGGEAAHWLGTVFQRAGEVEGPRTRLTSVPYAIRAAEADTLGGRPASDYQLAPSAGGTGNAQAATGVETGTSNDVVLAGTPNFLAKYVNAADVGNSGVFEAADGSIGLGTGATQPFDRIHVRYNNNTGDFTGLAVQNTNGGALAYSGMLFYDHTNALTQFQGYNNSTHEYRINNIARNGAGGAFNGSINFMIGGTSRFFVSAIGNIGIGTTAPAAFLDVSNALFPSAPTSSAILSTFSNIQFGSNLIGRKARGTAAAPSAVLNNDALLDLGAVGYGTTGFGNFNAAGISMRASENWTDAAHGTLMQFSTTANGATNPSLRMTIGASGTVGIGTNAPSALLEVSNGFGAAAFGGIDVSTYGTNASGSGITGRKARGQQAAPTAVLNNDALAIFSGRGYTGTTFGSGGALIAMRTSENWTDAAQGAFINFSTTANGTNTPATRMSITHSGEVGIGTTSPQAPLEIVRQGDTFMQTTAYENSGDEPTSGYIAQGARGTIAAPTAVLTGDLLGLFGMSGFGTTQFGGVQAAFASVAMENWTDAARGSGVGILATPIGQADPQIYVAVLPDGNVGLSTPVDGNGIPTALDKLQVFGDIRVGTTGTNGCLKNFAGTGIIGTCASDRRLKKDITPFAPALDKVAALQPVNYFWRTNEFPNRHFGNSLNYGLIAQDVEHVLPELVATDSDGYKAVDYSKLPLLTIQAVKELKAENDALKERVADLEELKNENVALKQRLAEIERLLTNALGNTPRR